MRLARAFVVVVLLCAGARAQDAPPPPPAPEYGFEPSPDDRAHDGAAGFLGTRKVKLADGTETAGPIVAGTKPGSGLEKAGVKQGDVLVGIGGWTIPPATEDPIGGYRERLWKLKPETETELAYWREGAGVTTVRVKLGRQPPPFARLETPAAWFEMSPHRNPQAASYMDAALGLDQGPARFESVLGRQRKFLARRDPLRLAIVTEAHLDLAAHESLVRLVSRDRPANVAAGTLGALSMKPMHEDLGEPGELEDVVARIATLLESIHAELALAFADWSPEDRSWFAANFEELTERLGQGEYLYDDEKPARERSNRRLVALLARVDRDRIATAADWATGLAGPVTGALAASVAERVLEGKGAGLLASRETKAGRIEVWGTGDQRHTTRCAYRFDLGGDDQYLDCGGRADVSMPVSITVDASGDDVWNATSDFGLAGALCGIGIVRDEGGDDRYAGTRWCMGAAAAGFASLMDSGGDDTYRAQDLSQAVGLCGAGVLEDESGDDLYIGPRFCQGVGLPGGVGALFDQYGADRYVCDGRYESEYGEAGLFSGWGQGVGFGFRGVASGGIGLLRDFAGNDVYEAGNFSQACGYFYGWGILCDDAGNDRYLGSRYAQGAAAHQAVATFVDESGDDVYRSVSDVAQGLAWDESAVLFRDRAGNDRYTTAGFSLASAAHNGMVLFIDDAGDDVYAALPAHAAQNTYHGGKSFALFLDRGGKDRYGAEPPEEWNDRAAVREDGAYFVDSAADPEDWRTLLR